MVEIWFNAIYSSDIIAIKKIIKSGIDINMKNTLSSNGDNALMEACLQNNIILIDLLIDNGADVNFKNDYNNTPLHFCKGFTNAAKMLIESGADLTIINNFNQSILKNWIYGNCDIQEIIVVNQPDAIKLLKTYHSICKSLLKKYEDIFNMDDIGLF